MMTLDQTWILQILIPAQIEQPCLKPSVFFMLFIKPVGLAPDLGIAAADTEPAVELFQIGIAPGRANLVDKLA